MVRSGSSGGSSHPTTRIAPRNTQEPAALVGQQVRVLADPAEPGPRGERALGERPIVHVRHVAGRQAPPARRSAASAFEAVAQGDVVVGAERVARDPAGRLGRRARRAPAPAPSPARADPDPTTRGRPAAYEAATTMTDRALGVVRAAASVARSGRSPPIQPMRPIRPAATLASIRARSSGSGDASVTPTTLSPSARRPARRARGGISPSPAADDERRRLTGRRQLDGGRAAWRPAGCGTRTPTRTRHRRSARPTCGRRGRRRSHG